MENVNSGFLYLPHNVGNILFYLNLTERQWRTVWLIVRLTYGCQKRCAKLRLIDFDIAGISPYHIREVIDPLIESRYILWNRTKKEFRINEEYLITEFTTLVNKELERLASLIGKNLMKKTSRKGKEEFTEMGKVDLPKEEIATSQSGKKSKRGLASVKDIIKNRYKNSDKDSGLNAGNNIYRKIDPTFFIPTTEQEYVSMDSWQQIEPDNPDSFSFYLYAAKNVPKDAIYMFVSEIKQDKRIKNKGAVFVNKVKSYLKLVKSNDRL